MIDLKAKRAEKGMTQQQLADEIHCVRTVIANIESGLTQPSIPTAKALGKALGFEWWKFYDDGGESDGADSVHGPGSGQASEN
jgi:DNA-binding XRE family transcriptional regulator